MNNNRILLSILRLDFQIPECLIEETVVDYVAQLREGKQPPPIEVRFDGCAYFLQDGFHRVEAARREGIIELFANIRPGTLADMEAEFCEEVRVFKQSLRKETD